MLKLYPTKTKKGLEYPPVQLAMLEKFISDQKEGSEIEITFRKRRRHKSHNQVKAHFGLVVQMVRNRLIEMHVDVCGIYPNKDMIHDILKMACGGVGDNGEVLGLSEMTTIQASRFFENCQAWAATQLSLDIPDPDPNWKEKSAARY